LDCVDNVFLYADNDRVTDIFTTYNVSMKEALEHDKTKNINRVSGYDAFKLNRSKHRIIEHRGRHCPY
jgi:hypothetical protein